MPHTPTAAQPARQPGTAHALPLLHDQGRPAGSRPASMDSAQLWRLLAVDAQECGDAARALQCWRAVAQREASAPDVLFHIGCCHALLQEPGRACLIFDALAHAPGTPAALRSRSARLLALLEPRLH